MITTLLLWLAAHGAPGAIAPPAVVVATSRGVETVPVASDRGYPALPAPRLEGLLPVQIVRDGEWAVVDFAGQSFRFLLDAPVFTFRDEAHPLAGGAYVSADTLYVPLQWLAGFIPQLFAEGYRYDPLAARFEEVGMTPVMARVSRPGVVTGPDPSLSEAARRLGFKRHHKVVIDPGHGGPDPGTMGRYLPRGMNEKHVALAVAEKLATVLEAAGIEVVLTRTADVLIPFEERATMCREDCDLFVSIHVNALNPGSRRERVRGVETYFLVDRLTTQPGRVAALENESIRYESPWATADDALSFIVKDLARNEYLRESALLAELVQDELASVHPGGGRRVAQDNFIVLRLATRPAILVETGYGSNRQDGRYLASPEGQQTIADAIADGIVAYLLRYEEKTAPLPARSR